MRKPFQDASFLMKFLSEDKLFGEYIRDVREDKLLIRAILWVHVT